MPPFDLFIAFLLAASIFAYMPGPSTLYAAAQTIAGGRHAGWMAALGIHIGGYVHVFAAAFGLAILFQLVPILYTGLKFGGAAYLLWLGYKMFTAETNVITSNPDTPTFWQSAMVEVLNPKTAIFYLAFLPQFTDPIAGLAIWMQLLVLGTIVNIMFSSADILCVLLADQVTQYFKSSGGGRWAQRLGGTALVALGLNLAFSPK